MMQADIGFRRFSAENYSVAVLDIIERVEELIFDGTFPPGYRLVESELMERFGAGRMPTREAIRVMAGDGILQLTQNRGARVRPFEPERLIGMLHALTALMCGAIRILAEKPIEPATAEAINAANDRIQEAAATGTLLNMIGRMCDYNSIIIAQSRNVYLIELGARVHIRHYQRPFALMCEHWKMMSTADLYKEITSSILARDEERARRLLYDSLYASIAGTDVPTARKDT